jgi:16S rRNA (cytosine1402-N4)-methyltransferase
MSAHQPVMINEVLESLQPQDNAVYIDATFGRGGYSSAILNHATCTLMAIDRDPDAILAGQPLVAEMGGRFILKEGSFSAIAELARAAGLSKIDGIVFDLGLSSPQLDDAERGFSFRLDGPLDMRIEKSGRDAADFINAAEERDIANILWQYGEERASRKIARAIVKARAEAPITRTKELTRLIHNILPRPKPGQIDPATRTFQAIRIHINSELDEIKSALIAAEHLLKPEGRLVVVSFHSLEDRIIKKFMMKRAGQAPRPSRHRPDIETAPPSFSLPSRKPVLPTAEETKANPRARSAKLRLAIRTDAPVMKEVA